MNLFADARLSGLDKSSDDDHRTAFERDFDRILFCAPVRRLVDKTQVFPMEKNDSVRNRLTHSHEVSNLARSLAHRIARASKDCFGDPNGAEAAPVIAAAVGLAHDVGNPPYGHQGEKAIGNWFKENEPKFCADALTLTEQQRSDMLDWEGNAQAFRLLTRLQVSKGDNGIDLTVATLAALMKYTVPSDRRAKRQHPAKKKFGFFAADSETASIVFEKTGLTEGKRHPIAYIMEAADDIAYSVIDIEDAIKKRIVSIHDVMAAISEKTPECLYGKIKCQIDSIESDKRDPSEENDISAQYFRTYVIDFFMRSSGNCYKINKDKILLGEFEQGLIDSSEASDLCEALKDFARRHAFSHPAVKEIELQGEIRLHKLADFLWRGVEEWSLHDADSRHAEEGLLKSNPTSFGKFIYSHISRNYRTVFGHAIRTLSDPAQIRYHQLLLLTDMLSGMTETFSCDLLEKFERLNDGRTKI